MPRFCAGRRWGSSQRLGRGLLEFRIVRQDRLLQTLQRPAGFDPELLHECASRLLVHLERLGLAARAVEGKHQLATQTLLQRMLRNQCLELANQVGVAAEHEIRVDALAQRAKVKLVEPADLVAGERLVGEVDERRSSPQRERLTQQKRGALRIAGSLGAPSFLEPLPEAVDIELAIRYSKCVTPRLRAQTVVTQNAAQL